MTMPIPRDQLVYVGILAAVFTIISSPKVYEITSKLAPSGVALTRPGAQPTPAGLVVHAAVFGAAVIAIAMYQHKIDIKA